MNWFPRDEDDAPYDGPLSHAGEWHALAHGVYDGYHALPHDTNRLPDDVRAERAYYKAGYMIGTYCP